MPRRAKETIEQECEALIGFADAFLGQLHLYRSESPAYYQRKAKTLRDYRAPTASIRLRGLKMGVRDLLEMTDNLSPDAMAKIDEALAARGHRTLSQVRQGL